MKRKIVLFSCLLCAFLSGHAQTQQTSQAPALLGVDHIGINVPDLQQAINFFTDVLGFSVVTKIGPVTLDSTWKKGNRMQPGTGPVSIRMTRAGYGANIELFHYENSEGSHQQPGGDDIGATHIAFYTADIKASVASLQAKGVSFIGAPYTMTMGDTEGETWVYFLTPWGSKMELVSYPNGKAYEKNHPAVRLWSPKDVAGNPAPAKHLHNAVK